MGAQEFIFGTRSTYDLDLINIPSPISVELNSSDRLEEYAASLCEAHAISDRTRRVDLACQLRSMARDLASARRELAQFTDSRLTIDPTTEWFLDNYHLLERQARSLRAFCRSRGAKLLPLLREGQFAGLPRIYAVARSFLAHTDCQVESESLERFVSAYQRHRDLTTRELWAIDPMLRLVMLENARRLAAATLRVLRAKHLAQLAWESAELLPTSADARASLVLPEAALRSAFVIEIVRHLPTQQTTAKPWLDLIQPWLVEQAISFEELLHREHADRSAATISLANLIRSLRILDGLDSKEFFERVSPIVQILRSNANYEAMDFPSRDRYRWALTDLSEGSGKSERLIAQSLVERAQVREQPENSAVADPGYYLIGPGREAFERELNFRAKAPERTRRLLRRHPILTYWGASFVLSAAVLGVWLHPLWNHVIGWQIVLIATLGWFPATEFAVSIVTWTLTRIFKPQRMPRLNLEDGVPPALRTVVAVPTLLASMETIEEQVRRLELHFLSNPAGEVYFALLSDWTDADTELADSDAQQLAYAREQIAMLNARYGASPSQYPRFFLLHRYRKWNASEGKWMGWERKRGKLHEFNRFLQGARDTSFVADDQLNSFPTGVRYVVTLDGDTQLPPDAVVHLVSVAAHPLHQPHVDLGRGRVVRGYGVLQPRVSFTLPRSVDRSLFQRMFSGSAGFDAYSGAVSDVYQDLFGEGNFTGKGLYDVAAFEASLAGRVPENSLLSHDLFEGVFARCALVSDIEVFEEFPSHTEVAASRAHRWTRGDWQLVPWIMGGRGGVPLVGRLKMLNNLRRSLFAPTAVATLVAAWCIQQLYWPSWFALVALAIGIAPLLGIVEGSIYKAEISLRSYWRRVSWDCIQALIYTTVTLALLAHHAWLAMDAIARATYRLAISHRSILQWTTAAQAKDSSRLSIASFLWPLRSATLVVIGASGVVLWRNPMAFPLALPLLATWWLAPLLARAVSLPDAVKKRPRTVLRERSMMRMIARRTWYFFERFVGPEDNYLPPDNYQEDPKPVVAHRSSPTNFGLGLLSIIAARDFGWLGWVDTINRLEAMMASMHKLERYKGHFLNWYDTQTLAALEPRYVSVVDSGNLAAHLIVLAQALDEMCESPMLRAQDFEGSSDCLVALQQEVRRLDSSAGAQRSSIAQISELLSTMEAILRQGLQVQPAGADIWRELDNLASRLKEAASELNERRTGVEHVLELVEMLSLDVGSHVRDVEWAERSVAQKDAAPGVVLDPDLQQRARRLAEQARGWVHDMDFGFLFDSRRNLFPIGYRLAEQAFDDSYYDLLASEARLASFLAIAKHEVPASHWFNLGRDVVDVDGKAVLRSWSGSMFEYLMPSLVLYTPHGSLLDIACRGAIRSHIRYAQGRQSPWGVSESALNIRDEHYTYQYAAFGVPELGLKRGLEQDHVIAPYATALAGMYAPSAAASNWLRLTQLGALGRFGFYEAVDFTASRISQPGAPSIVKSYMAHHQGMSLVALCNSVLPGIMRHRFHREAIVEAAELILQERAPRDIPRYSANPPSPVSRRMPQGTGLSRRFKGVHFAIPHSHVLANGKYSVMMTTSGAGYSMLDNLQTTRWRADRTMDVDGAYFFYRDCASLKVWSATYQPTLVEPREYETTFAEERITIRRLDEGIESKLDVMLASEDDAEIRHLTLTNLGSRPRTLEVTSYAELALATRQADQAHPVFSKMFIQTEYVPGIRALLATRRPREPNERPLWLAQVFTSDGDLTNFEYETDRNSFIGRGRDLQSPSAMIGDQPLSNTVGGVLDPILSQRVRLTIQPGMRRSITVANVVAWSREAVLELADKYSAGSIYERVSASALAYAVLQLRHMQIENSEVAAFQELGNFLLFAIRPAYVLEKRDIASGGNARMLWGLGISGDIPIALVRIKAAEDRQLVADVLRAQDYLQFKGLRFDVVLLNEEATRYDQPLHSALELMLRTRRSLPKRGEKGGIFLLRADQLSDMQRSCLLRGARIVLDAGRGTMARQLARMMAVPLDFSGPMPALQASRTHRIPAAAVTDQLEFFNGFGGFARGGREYEIHLGDGRCTPAPWVNVIANPQLGFVVSESGSSFTWALNSHENQLTPWSNDPVSDTSGEVVYLLDEDTGNLWTPTALPLRDGAVDYVTSHGSGYSRFRARSGAIASELTQFVAESDPIKISRLRLHNSSSRAKRILVTFYCDWVLGATREGASPHVVTELDEVSGVMLARNPWSEEFGERVAFVDMQGKQTQWTADRTEFLGRHGSLRRPRALLMRDLLSGRTGANMDPCCAMQTSVIIAPFETAEVVCVTGQGNNRDDALRLAARYRQLHPAQLLSSVSQQWEEVLGKVNITTSDRGFDIMMNGWALYQTLSCRMFARAGFYQAGGAYGFRDQLQDCMALVYSAPQLTREHLLRAAARQFEEGDVQHWWHPPGGRGVRTRISDDRLWLAAATAHYVEVTDDKSVLNELVRFLTGPSLEVDSHDVYFEPGASDSTATLFEHCARALDASLRVGDHGLPLMGAGDWNDGMNRVGAQGKGESIWLAWFLIDTLRRFAPLAIRQAESQRAQRWSIHAQRLRESLEEHGWDGAWYRRAYFDDGSTLGSAADAECRIDSIAQSWSVLSGGAPRAKAERAMRAVTEHLVRRGDGLTVLFAPPFSGVRDAGYISAYPPGVRENGGQYTHAAVWCWRAYAELGNADMVAELLETLNPIHRAATRAGVHVYRCEPYVFAGDIYSEPPHVRRGGWSWYTGAAGWFYRTGLESVLGVRVEGAKMTVRPCVPQSWQQYTVSYQYGRSRYVIRVELDKTQPGASQARSQTIDLIDDGGVHHIQITCAPQSTALAGSEL